MASGQSVVEENSHVLVAEEQANPGAGAVNRLAVPRVAWTLTLAKYVRLCAFFPPQWWGSQLYLEHVLCPNLLFQDMGQTRDLDLWSSAPAGEIQITRTWNTSTHDL